MDRTYNAKHSGHCAVEFHPVHTMCKMLKLPLLVSIYSTSIAKHTRHTHSNHNSFRPIVIKTTALPWHVHQANGNSQRRSTAQSTSPHHVVSLSERLREARQIYVTRGSPRCYGPNRICVGSRQFDRQRYSTGPTLPLGHCGRQQIASILRNTDE